MKLHFPSVLVAFGVAATAAFLSSQSQPATLNPTVLRVEYMPHPRDMVQIIDGTPFTVPPGTLFVLTGLGALNPNPTTSLYVDGVRVAAVYSPGNGDTWIRPTPVGLTAQPGSVVSVDDGNSLTDGRAWGYLASQ